jgi:3-oxoadipate enol-lactonase
VNRVTAASLSAVERFSASSWYGPAIEGGIVLEASVRSVLAARPFTRASRSQSANWHEGGNGPLLVLLNGWTASGLAWPRALVHVLERSHRVIRIDNRGTGWSREMPSPFRIADLADDAAAVIKGLGSESATVVGLSMGGMIAQELALRHPSRVARLIILASRPPAPRHIAMDVHLAARLMGRLPPEPLPDVLRRIWGECCGPGFAAEHPEALDEMVEQILIRPTPRVFLMAQARAIAGWAGAERLKSLAVPTTIVHGEEDRLMPVGNGIRLAQLIPGARYVELGGVGHLVPLEAPVMIEDLVLDDTAVRA